MSNPTSNFGWQMPTATDLVTDLPADFEVFGQAVDSSLADLKGGTTGQILSKATGTDMDFTWITNDVGDITAVTAGTGITGGGTTGAVTITNDMATTITAAGDIVVGTGSGTYDNLPIGTTAQVLTADTTVSPYKVKWATPASPTFVGCSLQKSTQSLANATLTAISYDTEIIDTNAFHDNVTNNSRVTIPAGYAGKYLLTATLTYDQSNGVGNRYILFGKNGGTLTGPAAGLGGGGVPAATFVMTYTHILSLAVADYVEVYGSQSSGGALSVIGNASGTGISNFTVTYLGA